MKRILTLVICLLLATIAFPQDNKGFFGRLKNAFVVHDTVYIYQDQNENDSIVDENKRQIMIANSFFIVKGWFFEKIRVQRYKNSLIWQCDLG